MHSTWNVPPSAASLLADRVGHAPADAGVDLVEDQRLPGLRRVDARVLSASMMRDSSPPETMRASGRRSSPGLGETKNSAASMPRLGPCGRRQRPAVEADLEAGVLHRQFGELRLRAPARTATAAARRVAESARAAAR